MGSFDMIVAVSVSLERAVMFDIGTSCVSMSTTLHNDSHCGVFACLHFAIQSFKECSVSVLIYDF